MENKLVEIINNYIKENNKEIKYIHYLDDDRQIFEDFVINKYTVDKYFKKNKDKNTLIKNILTEFNIEEKYDILKESFNNKLSSILSSTFKDTFMYNKDKYDLIKYIIKKDFPKIEMLKYFIENDDDLINYISKNKENEECNIYLLNHYKEICQDTTENILIYILNEYEDKINLFIDKHPKINDYIKKENPIIGHQDIITKKSEFKLDGNIIRNNYYKYNLSLIYYYKLIKEISKNYAEIIKEDIEVKRDSQYNQYAITINDSKNNINVNKISENYEIIIDKYIKLTNNSDDVLSVLYETNKNNIDNEMIQKIIYDIEINNHINEDNIFSNEETKLEYLYYLTIDRNKVKIDDEFEYSIKIIKTIDMIENEYKLKNKYKLKIENSRGKIAIRSECRLDMEKIKWTIKEMLKIKLEDYSEKVYKSLNIQYELKNINKNNNNNNKIDKVMKI